MDVNTELHGEDAQSRFQVYDRPHIHPGSCACCGAVDRAVVDFGVSVDFEALGYGALLLCETCVCQAASKFVGPVVPITTKPELTEDEVESLRKRINDDLTNTIYSWAQSTVIIRREPDSVKDSSSDEGSESEADRASDATDESSSKSRSDDVPKFSLGSGVFDL